jgi:hypothetical protein
MWFQRLVENHAALLDQPLLASFGEAAQESIAWKSPLAPSYKEFRDMAALRALGVTQLTERMDAFWPRRGPVWDGLGITPKGAYVLVEAKAHIPELMSGGCKAEGKSLETIRSSLIATRKALAPRSKADWAGPFFQYANRLAFLRFLRETNQLPVHLAFVYFTNDKDMNGPTSEQAWLGAIRLMEASLGLGSHRLTPFVHKVFIDTRQL